MLLIFLKLPSETPSQACEDAEVPQGSISPTPAQVGNCAWVAGGIRGTDISKSRSGCCCQNMTSTWKVPEP